MGHTKIEFIEIKSSPSQIISLDVAWVKLIEYISKAPFTEMTIIFKDGKPFQATLNKESFKF